MQGIYKTSDVLAHDPGSVSCANSVNVISEFCSERPFALSYF